MEYFEKYLKEISDRGCILIGSRRSGKSYLAEFLNRNLEGNTQLLDAFALVRTEQASILHDSTGKNSTQFVNRELKARLNQVSTASPFTLIVDNAEILLSHISEDLIKKLIESILSKSLRLIFIRNRFVKEGYGWLYLREMPLSSVLPKIEITPPAADESLLIASSFFRSDSVNDIKRQQWLSEWSGGLPGLMFDLKPYTPRENKKKNIPPLVQRLVFETAIDIGLVNPFRRATIEAIFYNRLAPIALLQSPTLEEVGFFIAIGMVKPDYATETYPFNGLFWQNVAASVIKGKMKSAENYAKIAKRLIQLLSRANLSKQIAYELGCKDVGKLPQLFERSYFTQKETKLPSIKLELFLEETLGKVGLRQILRTEGKLVDSTLNIKELSVEVLILAQTEA